MDFCDNSVSDWDAVAAVGTWAVGLGAAFLAWKTAALAHQLHREASARDERGARIVVAGIRYELRDYAERLANTAQTLTNHITAPSEDTRRAVQAALEDTEKYPLRELGDRTTALGALPQPVSDSIGELYTRAAHVRELMILALDYYRVSLSKRAGGAADAAFDDSVREASGGLTIEAGKVAEVVEGIGDYLDLPAPALSGPAEMPRLANSARLLTVYVPLLVSLAALGLSAWAVVESREAGLQARRAEVRESVRDAVEFTRAAMTLSVCVLSVTEGQGAAAEDMERGNAETKRRLDEFRASSKLIQSAGRAELNRIESFAEGSYPVARQLMDLSMALKRSLTPKELERFELVCR